MQASISNRPMKEGSISCRKPEPHMISIVLYQNPKGRDLERGTYSMYEHIMASRDKQARPI